jgi:hypothetical protein
VSVIADAYLPRLDPAGGEARPAARRRADVEEPGVATGRVAGRDRRRLPHPPTRRRALPVPDPGALEVKCREGGRTVNACVVHAIAVNPDGFRESLVGALLAEQHDAWAWPPIA